jgi:hypothetical protein
MYSCSTLFSKYFRRYGLENINLSQNKIWRPPLWSNETDLDFCHQSANIGCQQCIFQPHVNFICTLDSEVFNFSEKITTEFSTCQSTILKRRWLDFFCNYYHIQCFCNHSTALVVNFLL